MLSIYIQGGLGNQLFQIFTLISLSIDSKNKFAFPTDLLKGCTKRHTYWDSILYKLKCFTITKRPEIHTIKEIFFH